MRPPGPRGHWLTGNTVEYEKDRIGFIRRNHREYGDVFSFSDRVVFVIDPRLAHEVMAATNRAYVTESPPLSGTTDPRETDRKDHPWMRARRVVRPALDQLDMADRIAPLLDEILGATGSAEADVLPLMREFTARLVAESCFGADAAGIPELLAENLAAVEPFEKVDYQFPAWLPLPRNRRLFRVHRKTVDALTRLVDSRVPGGSADLLDVLLGLDMPSRTVMTTLRTILIGGHGIPAAAMTSIIRELACRPELAAEVAGSPPLAEAVVKETLRLAPPAWLMTRVVRAPVELAGWRLRPGDEVLCTPYLIHRDPRWWPRPEEFDPARWRTGSPRPGTYLPFGAGARYCLGATPAMRQLTLATSHIARRFQVHAPRAAEALPDFCGRLTPVGLRAEFRPRP